jgi:hypothetical protein
MAKLVKYADDMVQAFTGKTAPDRVGRRYGAAKEIAVLKYAVKGLNARSIVEAIRGILTDAGVPSGRWGVHIAFGLKLWKMSQAYNGVLPKSIIDGLITEYTLKGASPDILTKIASMVPAARV